MPIRNLPPTPVPLMLGLALTAPTDLVPGIEVAGLGYERVPVDFVWPADDSNALVNTATFEWPRATGFWGSVGWVTLWNLAGAYIGFGPVVDPITEASQSFTLIDRGDIARVKAGDIVIRDGVRRPGPFGIGPYGRGPWSLGLDTLVVTCTLQGTFSPASSPCGGAPNWQMEALPS